MDDEPMSIKPAKNSIRTADLHSSWFVTDNDSNPSTKGADLNLHRFKNQNPRGEYVIVTQMFI